MNLPFPLVANVGPLLSLDDEPMFHRLLVRILGPAFRVEGFTSIAEFTRAIEHQLELQETTCNTLSQMIKEWREEGASLRDGIIGYWRSQPEPMASGLLVDFRMPHANGLEVLARPQLQAWVGGKLLLTAHPDDHIAVEAFNDGLISQFISKQMMADDPQRFVATVQAVCSAGNNTINRVWGALVSPQQQTLLNAHRANIEVLLRGRGWTQHAVFGEPFGILGNTEQGAVQWLQLETDESLATLLELLETSSISTEAREAIAARKSLVSMEVGGSGAHGEHSPAMELGEPGNRLLGAVFDVAEAS